MAGNVDGNVAKKPLKPQYRGLKPMRKGETRNPKGSSKKQRFERSFAKYVKDADVKDVYKKIMSNAKLGREFFVKEFMERIEGKVPSRNEMTGPDGGPLQIDITVLNPEAQAKIEAMRKKLSE